MMVKGAGCRVPRAWSALVGEPANQLAAPEVEQAGSTTLRLARVLLVTVGYMKRPFVLPNEIFVAR